MLTVKDIMTKKVYTVEFDASAEEAAWGLTLSQVGAGSGEEPTRRAGRDLDQGRPGRPGAERVDQEGGDGRRSHGPGSHRGLRGRSGAGGGARARQPKPTPPGGLEYREQAGRDREHDGRLSAPSTKGCHLLSGTILRARSDPRSCARRRRRAPPRASTASTITPTPYSRAVVRIPPPCTTRTPANTAAQAHREIRDHVEHREDPGALPGGRQRQHGADRALETGAKPGAGDRGSEEEPSDPSALCRHDRRADADRQRGRAAGHGRERGSRARQERREHAARREGEEGEAAERRSVRGDEPPHERRAEGAVEASQSPHADQSGRGDEHGGPQPGRHPQVRA